MLILLISYMTLGSVQEISTDDKDAKKAIEHAIKKYNEKENENLEFKSIDQISSQIVAGIRFIATITCLKNGVEKHYFVDIWCQPNFNSSEDLLVQKFEPCD